MIFTSRHATLIALGGALLIIVGSFFFFSFSSFRNNQLSQGQSSSTPSVRLSSEAFTKKANLPSQNATRNLAYLISSQAATSYQVGVASQGLFPPVSRESIDHSLLVVAAQKVNTFTDVSLSSLSISSQATPEEQVQYIARINALLRQYATHPSFKALRTKEFTPSKIQAASTFFSQQEKILREISVPEQFSSLHLKLLTLTHSYRVFFQNVSDYANDPLGTVLAVQYAEQNIAPQTQRLTEELSRLSQAQFSSNPSLISTAHAQVGFVPTDCVGLACIAGYAEDAAFYAKDLANWLTEYGQTLYEWAQKLATEQMKNTLVQLFVKETVNWVNGGGDPQFITNWRVFTNEAYARGTQKGLSEVSDEACSIFGSSMVRQLGNSFSTFYQPQNCAQGEWGQALDTFRNNSFYDGGWDAYGLAISPKGNYFQSYADFSSRITRSAETEKEAATNEGLANDGFKSTKICIDTPGTPPPDLDGSCPDGSEPISTTPGTAVKTALDKALEAPLDRIVNADNLIDLGFTMANSALSNIISQKEKGLTGLLGGSGIAGAIGDPANLGLETVCNSFEAGTSAHNSCLLIAGDTTGAAAQIIQGLDQTISETRDAATTERTNQNTLSDLRSRTLTIAREYDQLISLQDQLRMEIQNALWHNSENNHLNRVQSYCGNLAPLYSSAALRAEEATTLRGQLLLISQYLDTVPRTTDEIKSQVIQFAQIINLEDAMRAFSDFEEQWGSVSENERLLTTTQAQRTAIQTLQNEVRTTLNDMCRTALTPISSDLLP